jgi:hypothetical protein
MARVTLLVLLLVAIGALIALTPQPVSAAEYPNVVGTQPFSAAANFMSLPGYLRWQTFREQGLWITYAEAARIVRAQEKDQGLA